MPGWPKDTSPNVIHRVNEWAGLSRAQIAHRMAQAQTDINRAAPTLMLAGQLDGSMAQIPLWIGSVSACREIADEIVKLPVIERKDPERVLRLFVFAYHFADTWAGFLSGIPDLTVRRQIFQFMNRYITNKLNASDFVESGLQEMVVRDPSYLPALLKKAMSVMVHIWSGLSNPRHKRKFVKDVLDSPKGYSKTSRDMEGWRKPTEVDFNLLARDWLDGFVNQSVYNPNSTGETKSRREWIAQCHALAGQDEKDMMWFNLIMKVMEAADLPTDDVRAVKAYLQVNIATLIQNLTGLVPATEVTLFVNAQIDVAWRNFMG